MTADACAKCGHTEILDAVRLKPTSVGGVDDVQAVVAPTTGMVRSDTASDLRAKVCAACGYAELYVDRPELLADRWRAGER